MIGQQLQANSWSMIEVEAQKDSRLKMGQELRANLWLMIGLLGLMLLICPVKVDQSVLKTSQLLWEIPTTLVLIHKSSTESKCNSSNKLTLRPLSTSNFPNQQML